MLAPGSITLDKLDPALLALLQGTYSSGDSTGDTTEEQGYGITDAIISSAEFSTNAANGKNALYFSPTAPDEGTYLVDDIWYDTSLDTDGRPKYTPYVWDGDSWEPAPFGDASFRFLNAGKIATGVLDAAAIIRVGQYPTPEGSSRLEISGGNGVIDVTTTLSSPLSDSGTVANVTDATGMPSGSSVFTIKVDAGTPNEELITVTSRTGNTLTLVRGMASEAYAHDVGAEVTYGSRLYAGITILKNPVGSGLAVNSPEDQGNIPALFRLDGSAGSFFLGEGDDYIKFNTADSVGRLTVSGSLRIGEGAEGVAIGPNVSGAQDGIRIGSYNYWYRPSSVTEEYPGGGYFFRVGMSGTNLIRAHTDGTVEIEGLVNPIGGQIKGRLTIRLPEGEASDKFIIGRDVGALAGLSGTEWDGIRLNASNYFVLNNNASQSHLRVGDADEWMRWDSTAAAGGRLIISGQIKVGTGDESLTIGKNVATSRDGIRLGPKNYWYRPESVPSGQLLFQVDDGTANPTYIRLTKNGKVKFSGEIEESTSTGPIVTPADFRFGMNIDGTKDGMRFNANNYWYLPSSVADGQEIFRIASGGPNSTTTYISVTKGGEVLIKGYHQGGRIDDPITTPPTPGGEFMKLGANVSGNKDGLFLNANNFWYIPDSIDDNALTMRVGGTTSYMAYDTVTNTLSVTGSITATTGNIGGWAIGATSIASTGSPTYPITLLNDPSTPKIYIGAGAHASMTTPFYADAAGRFSIGDKMFFDPSDSQSFGMLTIIGRVRGAIDNVPIVPSDSGVFTANAVTITGTTPNQTAIVTTSASHTFALGDTVIIAGLTGDAAAANGAWQITAKDSTTFTVTGVSGATNGTYTGQAGTARVRELTMGLHPAYNGSPAGLGIRMDEYNYWFVNNHFRVGTSGSFMRWDGANLEITGRLTAQSGSIVGGNMQVTTGKIFAGANADSGARVTLDSTGLKGFNSGSAMTFHLDASSGALSISGYLTVGSATSDVNSNGSTSIQGNKIRTGFIESSTSLNPASGNTFSWNGTDTFSTAGMRIDLTSSQIITPGFRLDASGNGFFRGMITAGRGVFRGSAGAQVDTGSGLLSRVRTIATNSTTAVDPPTIEIIKTADASSTGYLSMYRPAGYAQGISFFIAQGEGGSGSNALLRAAIEHGSDAAQGFESGGLLRMIAFGSSTGATPGKIRIEADNSSSGVAGKIELQATNIYLSSAKGLSGIGSEGTEYVNGQSKVVMGLDTSTGQIGRGPRITYGTMTAATRVSGWSPAPKNGDLHFQYD